MKRIAGVDSTQEKGDGVSNRLSDNSQRQKVVNTTSIPMSWDSLSDGNVYIPSHNYAWVTMWSTATLLMRRRRLLAMEWVFPSRGAPGT